MSISVVGNQLKIEGERKGEEKREEEIKASYHDGTLEITMPAPKGIAARRIPIEAK